MRYTIITIIALFSTFVVGCGYKKDCNFILPHQYYLVKDSVTGKYAIMFHHLDYYRYYLHSEFIPFEMNYDRFSSANEAETFDDSCEAKGFARTAIEYIDKKTSNRFK